MNEKGCDAPGCDRHHYALGWCRLHYSQIKAHGHLVPERERVAVRVCRVEGCGRADTVDFHCRKHARQIRIHGRLTPELERLIGVEACSVPGCKGKYRTKGLCQRHYNKQRWQLMKGKKRAPRKAKVTT